MNVLPLQIGENFQRPRIYAARLIWRAAFFARYFVFLVAMDFGLVETRAESPISLASASGTNVNRSAIPFDDMAPNVRERVYRITRQPTISARSETEEFNEGIYHWLLEHPDRASLAWRRLGYPCAAITPRNPSGFGWTDGQGTEVSWTTALKNNDMHVWLAEGQAKFGPVLPTIHVRAVAIMRHSVQLSQDGRRRVTQQADVYLQTDSKAAAMIARMIGPAAPRLADTGVSQLQLFFSGLTRYFDEHPQDIQSLLAPAR